MGTIQITLPDGSSRQAPRGITPAEIARQISPRLAEEALVARVSSSNPPPAGVASGAASDGELVDLSRPLEHDARLVLQRPAKVHELAIAGDRKCTRLNSSHLGISYAVFCLKKKNHKIQ